MGTNAGNACDKPTQKGPDIDEEECKSKDKEAKGRVARGCLDANAAQDAIGRLNAEAKTIAAVDGLGVPVQGQDHVEQPFAAA